MALTITKPVSGSDYVSGNKKVKVRDIEFDSSYPTAGESLTPNDVGLSVIEQFIPHGPAGNSDGTAPTLSVDVRYDYAAQKLQAFETAGTTATPHAEVGSTESLADYHVRVTIVGY